MKGVEANQVLKVNKETCNTSRFSVEQKKRQAWKILENPTSLSARILKSIYFPHSEFLEAQLGSHPSHIWRAIIEGRETLRQGLIRRIGDGETTRIWDSNWIPRKENMRPIVSLIAHSPQIVSVLIDSVNACWNYPLIEQIFLPYDATSIQQISICTCNIDNF